MVNVEIKFYINADGFIYTGDKIDEDREATELEVQEHSDISLD